jgi:hypothetical protein
MAPHQLITLLFYSLNLLFTTILWSKCTHNLMMMMMIMMMFLVLIIISLYSFDRTNRTKKKFFELNLTWRRWSSLKPEKNNRKAFLLCKKKDNNTPLLFHLFQLFFYSFCSIFFSSLLVDVCSSPRNNFSLKFSLTFLLMYLSLSHILCGVCDH